jgi:4-amino-4-deoxy-L-arabinose transferase-like glycosyltransferase
MTYRIALTRDAPASIRLSCFWTQTTMTAPTNRPAHADTPAIRSGHPALDVLRRYGPALLALLLLLPPAFLLPPIPIDETRYVAVAWHMHLTGNWLVPHLNGLPYSDKPPLLFWLLNAIWTLTGIHAWSARLLAVLVTLANLALVRHLAMRLSGERRVADKAAWVWLGSTAVAAFANAIMFDMLLSSFSLLMWLAALDLDTRRPWRGLLLGGIAAGLGILAKGPVVLLVGGMPLLFAPWWSLQARRHPLRHYTILLGIIAIGAGLALSWALPAAHAGGPAYENALLFRQTLGRVASSFAHRRPLWWYLPVLPAMALPWMVSLGRLTKDPQTDAAPAFDMRRLRRFALAAFVPAFVAFCFISGKQPHYLLPLLPALALWLGASLAHGRIGISDRRSGVVIALLGAGIIVLAHKVAVGSLGAASFMWAGGTILIGIWLGLRGRLSGSPRAAALAMLAAVMAAKLAAVESGGLRFDTTPAAQYVARAQREHIPLLYIGRHNAAFDFAGRLREPVAEGKLKDVQAWAQAHPTGWIMTYDRSNTLPEKPFYRQPFLNRELMIWRAFDVLAAQHKR